MFITIITQISLRVCRYFGEGQDSEIAATRSFLSGGILIPDDIGSHRLTDAKLKGIMNRF